MIVEANKTILVVDDDPDVRDVVSDCLSMGRYKVVTAGDGKSARLLMETHEIDLAIIDLGLPDTNGLDLARELIEQSNAGIVILSGRSDTTEKVVGLEVGADDYMTKPFEPRELLARVRSVLRRSIEKPVPSLVEKNSDVYSIDGWQFDTIGRVFISKGGDNINLSNGEFDLLNVFVEHPNRLLTREQILEFSNAKDRFSSDRSVDIRIVRLRKKIEQIPGAPRWIKTVRNGGYIFTGVVTGE